MGNPAAKQGDKIVATDMHIVIMPPPTVPTLLPHPFNGILNAALSSDVRVMGLSAATVGSQADNTPPHLPTPPGLSFQTPPKNKGTIQIGSLTVRINGKAAARNGDTAVTCNDPIDQAFGKVVAIGLVSIGD